MNEKVNNNGNKTPDDSNDAEKKLILVVDDDDDARSVVRTILSSSGYEVDDVNSGQDALDQIDKRQPDALVLDIMMPGMSGYDVVVRLKQKPETQNIPIIMLTAKSDPEDLLNAYKDYAIDYYIPKPFTTKQLLAGVKLVLTEEGGQPDESDSE